MEVTKLMLPSNAAMPLIAALPYRVVLDGPDVESPFTYNPETQISVFASRRDYSTCREDESVGGFFAKSKSDTKKDD
jgi:hypothetical protein